MKNFLMVAVIGVMVLAADLASGAVVVRSRSVQRGRNFRVQNVHVNRNNAFVVQAVPVVQPFFVNSQYIAPAPVAIQSFGVQSYGVSPFAVQSFGVSPYSYQSFGVQSFGVQGLGCH